MTALPSICCAPVRQRWFFLGCCRLHMSISTACFSLFTARNSDRMVPIAFKYIACMGHLGVTISQFTIFHLLIEAVATSFVCIRLFHAYLQISILNFPPKHLCRSGPFFLRPFPFFNLFPFPFLLKFQVECFPFPFGIVFFGYCECFSHVLHLLSLPFACSLCFSCFSGFFVHVTFLLLLEFPQELFPLLAYHCFHLVIWNPLLFQHLSILAHLHFHAPASIVFQQLFVLGFGQGSVPFASISTLPVPIRSVPSLLQVELVRLHVSTRPGSTHRAQSDACKQAPKHVPPPSVVAVGQPSRLPSPRRVPGLHTSCTCSSTFLHSPLYISPAKHVRKSACKCARRRRNDAI